MLASTMNPGDAALFGAIVVAVLLCLAVDRLVSRRREARAKETSDGSPAPE
jgi:hypothetical protein